MAVAALVAVDNIVAKTETNSDFLMLTYFNERCYDLCLCSRCF